MKRYVLIFVLAVLAAMPFAGSAGSDDWQPYSDSKYGFSMLVPGGTQMATREWPGGWGGMAAEADGVTVLGVAKLGEQASLADIERFGVELTGIPAAAWTQIDAGSGKGWTSYRTIKAQAGSKLVFGGYGTGPKGSYLILLETTPDDFAEYQADFEHWYESVRLH